ncbi:MAG TPA: vWA domain-containing protein [Gemmatimonadales bacterium]|nr:vWA domain-containing protein [Gemmatimonadales bacterium]
MPRLTPALVLLRATGVAALVLLLWNPALRRDLPGGDQPLILLDASLSMAGAPWRAALDTARTLARARHGVIWRFGDRVTAFDTAPPGEGTSHLGPALAAAATRGGPIIVVTDGRIGDAADLPADLRARATVIVLPRPEVFDAFVASVSGPRRLTTGDTLVLAVTVGTAGKRERGMENKKATLAASAAGRRLVARELTLPDSGTITTSLTIPVSRFPSPGWSALEVRLEGVGDAEPRDDARLFVVHVSPQPAAVVLAAPPDWESRFLARVLGDVARVPLKLFVETEPGRWRDGGAGTLPPVTTVEVARAAAGARLLAELGDPARLASLRLRGADGRLVFAGRNGREGDWYVDPPPVSPLAARLAGIFWDSLPPLASVADLPADSAAVPVLSARLARRGPSRPIVTVSERAGTRRVTVAAAGLWRWAFRGGASEQAYRSLIASLADFLLGDAREGRGGKVVPVTSETPNGLPLIWRWSGSGPPTDVVLLLDDGRRERTDTLRFDADGRAELRLPPGVYRYTVAGSTQGGWGGLVAVEEYSDEWRPSAPTLRAQPGQSAARRVSAGLRDHWWLFVLAIAAFVGEWAWRRRQGLP